MRCTPSWAGKAVGVAALIGATSSDVAPAFAPTSLPSCTSYLVGAGAAVRCTPRLGRRSGRCSRSHRRHSSDVAPAFAPTSLPSCTSYLVGAGAADALYTEVERKAVDVAALHRRHELGRGARVRADVLAVLHLVLGRRGTRRAL